MMSTTTSSAHKREFPFEDVMCMDSENSYSSLAASASTASAMKRVRMLDFAEHSNGGAASSRKRALPQPSRSPEQNQQMEAIREEARAQIRTYSLAVENLRQAVEATNADRERLVHDNRILRAGVLKLKSNNDALQQRCEQVEAQLNQAVQRNRMLESAIVALNANQRFPFGGGCGGPNNSPDQFHDRDVF